MENTDEKKRQDMGKRYPAVFIATVIGSLLFIILGYNISSGYNAHVYSDFEPVRARIVSIDSFSEDEGYFGGTDKTIFFTAGITNGDERGSTISLEQRIDSMFAINDEEVSVGDRILVAYTDMTGSGVNEWLFLGYDRTNALMILCGVFLLLILIIGQKKGISAIVSLVLTCLIIFLVYVPSILGGSNVYLMTAIVGIAITLTCLLLINGANKKTLCAILGNFGGVLITAIMALVMNRIMKLTGFIDQEFVHLALLNPDQPLNLVAIVWGGMVLGALGATMDVAVTIASSAHELAEHMQPRTFNKLMRSGMNIGRDAIGTMSNTLILAYIGGSLALVLLLLAYTRNSFELLSMEMIASHVVQAVTGSIGILFAVPFTAVTAAYLYSREPILTSPAQVD